MSKPIGATALVVLLSVTLQFANSVATAQPTLVAARPQGASWFDLSNLQNVNVDHLVKNGSTNGKTDFQAVIKEADERIAAIKARNGYTDLDVDILTSPWVKTKQFMESLQQGQPLPSLELAVRTQRNGVFDTGGTAAFKGDAKRAVEIVREIGLKDSAHGKSWSDAWGIMERIPTPLGQKPNGDVAVRVDVVMGVNKSWEFIYKQIYNVRDIERYAEHDLGDGNYVVFQDLIRDDSPGAPPRATTKKNWCAKEYYPVKEQISITIIHDNRNGTFTLGNFMSTHGQELKAVKGIAAKIFGGLVDLQKEMEKDTIANRKKWNELFQNAVLEAAK